jgi:hypothetical protein
MNAHPFIYVNISLLVGTCTHYSSKTTRALKTYYECARMYEMDES